MRGCRLLAILLVSLVVHKVHARMLPVELNGVTFTLARDFGTPEELPVLQAASKAAQTQTFVLRSRLVRPDGTETFQAEQRLDVPPGATVSTSPFQAYGKAVEGEIVLAHTRIAGEGETRGEISGVFGTPRPARQSKGGLFGMNVHLNRYRASTRWRLLQMMKEAGVTTVRVDCVFPDEANGAARQAAVNRLLEDLLALEAFGLDSVVCIAYFNEAFKKAGDKLRRAYEWGRLLATVARGRTSFHFGNETNSGWGAYGSADDMAALNKAFALGVLAVDPGALRGSFGIAEGPTSYVRAFCQTGALDYLDAIAIHPYSGTPEAGIAKAVAARKVLDAYGSGKQLWATEAGFHVDGGPGAFNVTTGELTGVTGFTEKHQALLLSRMYVLAASHGIDRVYWYDFFGRGDPETYWLVFPDYRTRPAYAAYRNAATQLEGAVAAGGTPFYSPIQMHLFKRPDGSRMLVCWALQERRQAGFAIPAHCTVTDCLGNAVENMARTMPTLGHAPLFVNGLSAEEAPELLAREVILSCMDKRTFQEPMHRFFASPGDTLNIPVTCFNAGQKPVSVRTCLLNQVPGWRFSDISEKALEVQGGAHANGDALVITIPTEALPGTEYEFSLQGIVDGLRLTQPCVFQVCLNGQFPYADIAAAGAPPSYPMRNPLKENEVGTGNPLLTVHAGKAVVDGRLDEWRPGEFHPIDQKFAGALRNAGAISDSDWSGQVALRWDAEKLYVAFLVRDDQLCFIDFLSRDWRDSDNIRLMLSAVSERERRAKQITGKDLLAIFAPTDLTFEAGPRVLVAALGGSVRENAERQIQMASQVWRNGYLLEAAVPFSLVGLTPAAGIQIGLNVLADDADEWHRQSVAMTRMENFLYWRSPSATGNAVLLGPPVNQEAARNAEHTDIP